MTAAYDLRDMPDRLRARAALAALLVLLTAAGTRAIGPAVSDAVPGRATLAVVGAALEVALAVLLIALRWHRPRSASPPEQALELGARLRRVLTGTLVTGLVLIPLGYLLSAVAGVHPKRQRPTGRPLGSIGLGRTLRPRLVNGESGVADVLELLLVAVLLAALLTVIVILWRQHRLRRLLPGYAPTADQDTPAELARAVGSGWSALREIDDARAAIIRCYLAMEASLAEAGAARGAAETPDELLARSVAAGLVAAGPAGALTSVFCQARFSTRPMPPTRRDDAERALADLAASLPATSPPATPRRQPAFDQAGPGT